MTQLRTASPAETEELAFALAPYVPGGAVLALYGDLAAGKTCFVRGLARHFAGEGITHSPTFTLVNEYGTGTRLFHLDLYRLSGPEELADLGYEELFDSEEDVCAVEWAERAVPLLPERRIEIHLRHGGGDLRGVEVLDPHDLLLPGWKQAVSASRSAAIP